MFCDECGAKIPKGSAFCEECGFKLDTDNASASVGFDFGAINNISTVATEPLFRETTESLSPFVHSYLKVSGKATLKNESSPPRSTNGSCWQDAPRTSNRIMKSFLILIGFLLKNKQSSPLVCAGLISTCDYIPISNKTAHALKDLLFYIQQTVESVSYLLGVGLVAVEVGEFGYI